MSSLIDSTISLQLGQNIFFAYSFWGWGTIALGFVWFLTVKMNFPNLYTVAIPSITIKQTYSRHPAKNEYSITRESTSDVPKTVSDDSW